VLHIVFDPFQLLVTESAESTGFQIHHVHQPDKVHAFLIEAVPSRALGVLP